ncbi:hypothetical protein ACS0TY_015140 [Phlomoides rotata]
MMDYSEQLYDATNGLEDNNTSNPIEYIQSIESSPKWSGWRDEFAQNMWVAYTTKKECASTSSGKKLNSRSENSEMSGEFFKCTGERLENIAQMTGYDNDIITTRKQVFEILSRINNLTLVDKLDVCEIIGNKIESLKIFIGLLEEARHVYVHRVLDRHKA